MVSSSVENELNIPLIASRLWRGKVWILGLALAGALIALAYARLASQVWSATATVDRPSVSQIANYYSLRLSLATLEDESLPPPAASMVTDEVYQQFLLQLSSRDSRRDFWLQSAYFRDKLKGHQSQRATILDQLIGDIRFQPAEPARGTRDTLVLRADNATSSAQLLDQYVQFASQRAAARLRSNLHDEWKIAWQSHQTALARQQWVAETVFAQQRRQLEQAITRAGNGQSVSITGPDSQTMPPVSKQVLEGWLANLLASGPAYDRQYLQSKALLESLGPEPVVSDNLPTWCYLRSPEPPASRDSPRLVLLVVLWGMTGAFAGAVIAVSRRR